MNKINKFLQNNIEKIVNYFIIIQPILDVIAAISLNVLHIDLTLSSIIRFAFLLLCIYYIMILDKTENNINWNIYTMFFNNNNNIKRYNSIII